MFWFIDLLSVASGSLQTIFTLWSYNQQAYMGNCSMTQNQRYQEKSYHLGWVAIARGDISNLMSTSVTRINNYMLVATLILGVAGSALTSVDLPAACPEFVSHAWYLNMGISVVYFSLSILFAVKGQNSAFLNTMRLLTWEVRPENPGKYTHNYMRQAQNVEKTLWSLFRMPDQLSYRNEVDVEPKVLGSALDPTERISGTVKARAVTQVLRTIARQPEAWESERAGLTCPESAPLPASPADPNDPMQEMEHVQAATRQLMYLARFGHFMQMWMPFDTAAKYCIGVGLVSMAQGSAFCSVGLLYNPGHVMSTIVAGCMMAVFTGMVIMIYEQRVQSGHPRSLMYVFLERAGVYVLFLGPPICGLASIMVTRTRWVSLMVAPACFLFHSALYGAAFFVTLIEVPDPHGMAQKFITGPDGQTFQVGKRDLRTDADVELAEDMKAERAASGQGPGEMAEEAMAREVQNAVTRTVRASLLLTSMIWLLLSAASAVDLVVEARSGCMGCLPSERLAAKIALAQVRVEEVQVQWPRASLQLKSVACSGSSVFVAGAYQVLRLQLLGGAASAKVHPCSSNRPFADVAAACDGARCRPLVLLHGSPPTVLDCDAGVERPLLRETEPATRFALSPTAVQGTLLALHGERVVEYGWSNSTASSPAGWSPLWERANISMLMHEAPTANLGLQLNRLFRFPPEPMVEVAELEDSADDLTRWPLPGKEPAVAACSLGQATAFVLTVGLQPRLLHVTVQG